MKGKPWILNTRYDDMKSVNILILYSHCQSIKQLWDSASRCGIPKIWEQLLQTDSDWDFMRVSTKKLLTSIETSLISASSSLRVCYLSLLFFSHLMCHDSYPSTAHWRLQQLEWLLNFWCLLLMSGMSWGLLTMGSALFLSSCNWKKYEL